MNINVLLLQAWDQRSLQRSASGVCAALLALRKLPVIRYSSASPLCQKLAEVFSARTPPTLPLSTALWSDTSYPKYHQILCFTFRNDF